jgi:hypothetical protein
VKVDIQIQGTSKSLTLTGLQNEVDSIILELENLEKEIFRKKKIRFTLLTIGTVAFVTKLALNEQLGSSARDNYESQFVPSFNATCNSIIPITDEVGGLICSPNVTTLGDPCASWEKIVCARRDPLNTGVFIGGTLLPAIWAISLCFDCMCSPSFQDLNDKSWKRIKEKIDSFCSSLQKANQTLFTQKPIDLVSYLLGSYYGTCAFSGVIDELKAIKNKLSARTHLDESMVLVIGQPPINFR